MHIYLFIYKPYALQFWMILNTADITYIASHDDARHPKLVFNVVCWEEGISVFAFWPN